MKTLKFLDNKASVCTARPPSKRQKRLISGGLQMEEDWIEIPETVRMNGETLVFTGPIRLSPRFKGYAVLDWRRKFDDPDLEKLPAIWLAAETPEQEYLIRKYEVVLGTVADL